MKQLLLATALVGFAFPASASFVTNGSFESGFTGWTSGSPGGGASPAATFGVTAPDGTQVGYSGPGNNAIIYQDTGVPVIAGFSYTLSVDVGQSADANGQLPLYDYRILIGYGGHDLSTTTFLTGQASGYTTNSGFAGPILPGNFLTISNSGTAGAGASGNILVFLEGGNYNAGGASGRALWDNVSLIFTSPTVPAPAPEPATLAILGAGLLGLGLARRRR